MGVQVHHRPGQKTFGPWGNHTSSLDWCEDNYTHLDFIAEFWNTFSNIPFVALGIWGIYTTHGLPHRARYALGHAFISLIGVGSFVFHGTLLWHAQVLMDELPMIWSGAMFLYTAIVGGEQSGPLWLKLVVSVLPLAISWLYLLFPNPVLHQVAYAAMQVVSATFVVQLYRSLPKVTTSQIRRREECKSNFYKGITTFLLGFAIWNVDNVFCDSLTTLRAGKGELVVALTQGHAWWHLLTGIGASRIISAMTYLTLSIRDPDKFQFSYFLGHPYVERVRPTKEVGPIVEKTGGPS